MLRYDAVLFDLDGTLIDTAPDFVAVLNRQRLAHGREPLPAPRIRAVVSQGARAVVALGFGDRFDVDSDEFEALRQEFLQTYLRHIADESRLFPGMDDLLRALEARNVPWGIVTNKQSMFTLPLLKALQLSSRCAVAICPDMVNHGKPHPEPMLKAADAVRARPEACVYVGDHRRDIEAGRNAGMYTVAVRYGYVLEGETADEWGADSTVDSVTELSRLLGVS
ncbi:MAG: phosphoglycolate phosphatase [Moraxellaceae bacterium]|jgi:phosphoglycolate phosphatase|nr:phosphoglycolate phosphatase [Moraxellaceae bacterium]